MNSGSRVRYCPSCDADVPAERRLSGILFLLLLLMGISAVLTAIFFPRFIFLFLFLPVGFGIWRRVEHCSLCGRRLPR